jgi:hypothetical protein
VVAFKYRLRCVLLAIRAAMRAAGAVERSLAPTPHKLEQGACMWLVKVARNAHPRCLGRRSSLCTGLLLTTNGQPPACLYQGDQRHQYHQQWDHSVALRTLRIANPVVASHQHPPPPSSSFPPSSPLKKTRHFRERAPLSPCGCPPGARPSGVLTWK